MAFDWGSVIAAGANLIAANNMGGKSWIPEAAWPHQLRNMVDPFGAVVDSAQAHGIHPVYAIGNAPAGPAISAMTGGDGKGEFISRMGQDLARAATPHMTKEQRATHEATLNKLAAEAENDFAQASYWRRKAMEQSAPGTAGTTVMDQFWPGVSGAVGGVSVPAGGVAPKAAEQLSSEPGARYRTPAVNPLFERVRGPDGEFEVFSPIQMEERVGEVGMAMMLPYLLGHNLRGVIADEFERIWPHKPRHKGERWVTRQDREREDYERFKSRGVAPRGFGLERPEYWRRDR